MRAYLFGLLRLARYGHTARVLWGRMVSCAPVGNRRVAAIGKRRQAGYQPAAGCQPAPQSGIFRHCGLYASIALLLASSLAAAPGAAVTVRNPIDLARPAETIVLPVAELHTMLTFKDAREIHVRPEGSDKDLLIQAVDTNDDGKYEELLFQADFAPRQIRIFLLTAGDRQLARVEDYKTYGRFVRERRDDFAWENDRIAHRMYGKELETWPQEPLTSSSVDVWTKRVPKLVINDWYMMDDYQIGRAHV